MAKFGSNMYRVENKYLLSDLDIGILQERLRAVMPNDVHQTGSCYEIRSIYFDDLWDSCIDENDAGVDDRRKYRIRTYGPPPSPIKLEIKEKCNGLTKKTSCSLTQDELVMLSSYSMTMDFDHRQTFNQMLIQMRLKGMRPKVVIAYERTAFVHPSGNVRITFDRNIVASTVIDAFQQERLEGCVPILPAGMHVLEVKYDEFLPDFIARQLELGKLRQTAFSKYYLGRLAINQEFPVTL